jgi:hypothetical protein
MKRSGPGWLGEALLAVDAVVGIVVEWGSGWGDVLVFPSPRKGHGKPGTGYPAHWQRLKARVDAVICDPGFAVKSDEPSC